MSVRRYFISSGYVAPTTAPTLGGDRLVKAAPAPTGLGKASLRVAQGGAIAGGVGTGISALGLMMGAFSRGGIVVAAALTVGAYAVAALGVVGLLWSERGQK